MSDAKDSNKSLMVRDGEEVWETTVVGTIWVQVSDGRGGVKDTSVGGRVGARLRITTQDRIINQEMCVVPEQDPFRNGMLVRLDADQHADPMTDSPDAISVPEMQEIFNVTGKEFQERVEPLGELSLRRMKEMADQVDATASQIRLINELLHARYPIGGDTPTYRELKNIGSVSSGTPTG